MKENKKMSHCTNDDLKPGKILSRLSYYVVKEQKNSSSVIIQNLKNEEWSIGNDIVKNECFGTSYTEEREVSLTNMVDIMRNAGDKVFLVTFVKKDGTSREMTAVLKGSSDTNFGRSLVRELIVTNGNLKEQERQVDHRTLASLILENVKYVIKGKKKKKSPENPEPKPPKKRKKKN